MKSKLITLSTLIIAMVLCGCKTILGPAGTPISVIDTNVVDKTAAVLKAATSGTVIIAVQKDAKSVPYLRLASAIIDKTIVGGDMTPTAIQKAIGAISVKELQRPEAQLAVTTALAIYEVYWGDYVRNKIGGNYSAVTMLTAVRDGINNVLPPLPTNWLENPEIKGIRKVGVPSRESALIKLAGNKYIGTFSEAVAERAGTGVALFSIHSGEMLRWIPEQEFRTIYIREK